MENESRRASYHEAGHVLMSWCCGAESNAYLKATPGNGQCKSSLSLNDADDEAQLIRQALICAGGESGEATFGTFDEAASCEDRIALGVCYEKLKLMKSVWASGGAGTFKSLVENVAMVLLKRYRASVEHLASDLRSHQSGLWERDVEAICKGDVPKLLAGPGWGKAFVALANEGADALAQRSASTEIAKQFYTKGAQYGISHQ